MLEQLRDYQREVVEGIDSWFMSHDGNCCVDAPTSSGKSWIIAGYVYKALLNYPQTRILILAPQRELIEQDRDKLLCIWPEAPVSTYCAALNMKELGTPITIATIQSIRKKAENLGHIDLVLIDEAHLINDQDTGMYRTFINDLKAINPYVKCVGFTATPYRLGHGLITDPPALFSEPLIKTRSIQWLQDHGYLCHLSSKHTEEQLDVTGVHKLRGDYKQSELEQTVDKSSTNEAIAQSLMALGKDRHSWLIFCSGVSHAQHMAEALRENGIDCETISGDTPADDRANIIERFKAGRLRAITNNNVLTTGFDAPNIDLIAILRPTMSPGLHAQILGRGLRKDPSKTNTLVLDFAGNIMRHGGIYGIQPPKHKRRGESVAPLKICPECQEYVPLSARVCPECGHEFPQKPKQYALSDADVESGLCTLEVRRWQWSVVLSRKGEIPMLLCRYYGYKVGDPVLRQYFCIMHEGYAREKAFSDLAKVCSHIGLNLSECRSIHEVACRLNEAGAYPQILHYKVKDGWPRIV